LTYLDIVLESANNQQYGERSISGLGYEMIDRELRRQSGICLVDSTADRVQPRVNRLGLDRLGNVPRNRGVIERIVLVEINVVAVVTINVVTLQ
jgi:hypothetical protein